MIDNEHWRRMSDLDDIIDDGATEVVDLRPARRVPSPGSVADAMQAPAGGKMALMRAKGENHSREFVIHRSPLDTLKIALAHQPFFAAIWRVWSAKRIAATEDPGATIAEIASEMDLEPDAIRPAIASLLKNHIIRSVVVYVGRRGARARYYPSEAGIQTFALAEVLGYGSAVQIGRTTSAWNGRNKSEPSDLFQHARLLRGGAEPTALDMEFA
ncbi:middle transcription regulatory protein [Bajunvirus bajun]|uniref:Middle transcription regulatory protein n=1 Tax=Brevundimonas phage vB_BgoS-Bajun TaxID=2948594 RepID=A0A9E7N4B6_9CAUD|nr:middle transcription regulatory protein [Brevundimonas phage vB_BgoS-Bajun]